MRLDAGFAVGGCSFLPLPNCLVMQAAPNGSCRIRCYSRLEVQVNDAADRDAAEFTVGRSRDDDVPLALEPRATRRQHRRSVLGNRIYRRGVVHAGIFATGTMRHSVAATRRVDDRLGNAPVAVPALA